MFIGVLPGRALASRTGPGRGVRLTRASAHTVRGFLAARPGLDYRSAAMFTVHGEQLGRARSGCIEVICGSMFSGKTEELLRRIRRARLARQRVQLFKPRVDDRYDAVKIVSHEGENADASPVATAAELRERVAPETSVVGIDEVQFFDESIVALADGLASRGIRVIAAGLDQDYRGLPFGPIPSLMAVAEYVTKLHAICSACGAPASRSQRLVSSEGQLFVGGAAAYEARCRHCFTPGILERPAASGERLAAR